MKSNGLKTKSQILKVFNDLIYEQGYNKTSISQIAQKIGISKGNISFHFDKKEEIMAALFVDLSAKIDLILSEIDLHQNADITSYLVEYYIKIYLSENIPPLYNLSCEMIENYSLLQLVSFAECKRLYKVIHSSDDLKHIDFDLVFLSVMSAYNNYFAACKLRKNHKINDASVDNLFNMFCRVLFSLLDLDFGDYLHGAYEKIEKIDLDRITGRVYELQDYNYKNELGDNI